LADDSGKDKQLNPLQQALFGLKTLKSRLDAVEQSKREPIAIVGAGCRFPGGATNPEKFWELLREGFDAIREVPSERWNIDDYYNPDPDNPGKISTRYGGFSRRRRELRRRILRHRAARSALHGSATAVVVWK
jgi:hypothetical protein